jgi:Protein of unknown function (DUF2637)
MGQAQPRPAQIPSWMSVDGMIVAASTTLLTDSRSGNRGGLLPWALLVAGSAASLAANVAVAEPTMTGRVIAAWPSFSLIAAYELLMRQVRRAAETAQSLRKPPGPASRAAAGFTDSAHERSVAPAPRVAVDGNVRLAAWRWAQDNQSEDGSLPSGRAIGNQYGRHERWGRLVKQSGLAGELTT